MKKYNITYPEALLRLNKDLLTIQENNIEYKEFKSEPKLVQVTLKKQWSDYDITYWNRYNISTTTLKLFNIHPVKDVYVNKKYVNKSKRDNPIFAINPIESRIKVYSPLSKNIEHK
jgi:hypothetical protein